jgi:hypothetical protein
VRQLTPLFVAVAVTSACAVTRTSDTSQAGTREWRIPWTESLTIRSAVNERDFEVTVAVPRGYAESSGKYPVLCVLDANYAFPIALEAARIGRCQRH